MSNPTMSNPVEFGFVAALEREVSRIVRGWNRMTVRSDGREWRIFRQGKAAVICAGTGTERAYAATKALIENCSPRMVISIGFAGACVDFLKAGRIVAPATLLDARSGRTFECAFGSGQVVTLDRVAGKLQKQEMSQRFGVFAVDMEAVGVATAAVESDTQVGAIKVISDGFDEDLDFLTDFVKPEGFETGRFIRYIGVRPWLWRRVADLQTNSETATKALAGAVEWYIKEPQAFAARYSDHAQV